MYILSLVFLLLFGFYVVYILILLAYKSKRITSKFPPFKLKISVLIAFRNEENNLVELVNSINKINYDSKNVEFIFVDDHSEDRSLAILKNCEHKFSYKVVQLPIGLKGKKAALRFGLELAQGEIIVQTDADCIVSENWLTQMSNPFNDATVYFVAGPVQLVEKSSLTSQLQRLEFISVVYTSLKSITLGYPVLCNAANMAYRKEGLKHLSSNPFNSAIASGDDIFLMHTFRETFGNKAIVGITDYEALVYTQPQSDLQAFVNQRVRWASKWNKLNYTPLTLLAIGIFFIQFGIVLAPILIWNNLLPLWLFLGLFIVKNSVEFLFLRRFYIHKGKSLSFGVFAIASLLYPFYGIITALLALRGKYAWKNRILEVG